MKRLTLMLGLCLFAFPVLGSDQMTQDERTEHEIEHDGVIVPGTAMVADEELVLNGVGTRRAFFRNFYVGALYLPEPMREAAEIITLHPRNRIALHFIRDVSESRMLDAIQDGFADNTGAEEMEELADKIAQFRELLPEPREGDRIYFDWDPERGTVVSVNREERGVVAGEAFNRAVMRIFLGENPADNDVREGMLGID